MIKMYIGLYAKYQLFFSDIDKFEFSGQIFENYSNIKFHENPSSGNRVAPCWRMDSYEEGNCILLGYYAASVGNSLPTFRGNLSVSNSRVKNPRRKIEITHRHDEANSRFSQLCESVHKQKFFVENVSSSSSSSNCLLVILLLLQSLGIGKYSYTVRCV
jgi:hypothetical protein